MEGERKKFNKKLIFNCIFFNNVTSIKTFNPALCRFRIRFQDKNCTQMMLSYQSFSSQSLLGFFPIAALFPALSIVKIPLDKCQMKLSENINILIKVTLFCLKNIFLENKLLFERKTRF